MTTGDASRRKPASAQRTMPGDRLVGVLGAAGMKAATRAQHGAHRITVKADWIDQQPSHLPNLTNALRKRASMSRCNAIFCGGRTSTSTGASARCSSLNASRIHRLMRLRTFARRETRSDIRMPRRAEPTSFGATIKVNPEDVRRAPTRNKLSYNALERMRCPGPKHSRSGGGLAPLTRAAVPFRQTGACGLSRAGRRSPFGLRVYSCG